MTLQNETNRLSRIALVKLAGIPVGAAAGMGKATMVPLFDGKTLDGWF